MRKRGKKRIPQDIKPWFKIREARENFILPAKKTSRWVSGGRRDWNTRVLSTAGVAEVSARVTAAIVVNNLNDKVFQQITLHKNNSKLQSVSKYKNFCLFSGRGRTYSRDLFMARHNIRKLVSVGLISGLIK